jgi:murein endopeptidase
VTLLSMVAALVPLAAMDGEGADRAAAQPAVAQAPEGPQTRVRPAPPSPPRRGPDPPRPRAAAPSEQRPRVEWRDSRALGTPNAGSLVNGVRLPAEGPGYYTYNPATQAPPGGPDRTWGHARVVREVLELGEWWARTHPDAPRLGIGDLSRPRGGPFHGPVVGHASHQNGLDVDIRLVRRDGAEAAVDQSSYDPALTQALVDRLVARGASLVLIGPRLHLHGPPGVVMPWPNHDDHLHVRFPNPG